MNNQGREDAKPHPLQNYRSFFRYRYRIKVYATVLANSMFNKLGRLPQGCQKHAVTDTIEFILHKDKPKERRATHVRAVCDIRPHKNETHRTRPTVGGNIIDYPGEFSTPT